MLPSKGDEVIPHIGLDDGSEFVLLSSSDLAASPSRSALPDPAAAATAQCSPLLPQPLYALGLTHLTAAGEGRIRRLYLDILILSGRLLDLSCSTVSSACVYWNRFFARATSTSSTSQANSTPNVGGGTGGGSLCEYHPSGMICASLFVASKVCEEGRRLRDVINTVWQVEQGWGMRTEAEMAAAAAAAVDATTYDSARVSPAHRSPHPHSHPNASGSSLNASASHSVSSSSGRSVSAAPPSSSFPTPDPLPVSALFWEYKDLVLRYEQILLRSLCFSLRLTHPHQYVLHIAREMEVSTGVARTALYIVNDIRKSTLEMQYQPQAVACAAIYLAAEMNAEIIRCNPTVLTYKQTTKGKGKLATSASPYRSPYPYGSTSSTNQTLPSTPSAAPSSSGGGGSSHTTTPSSAPVLHPSRHAGEWWEVLSGFSVNRLQFEDILHQILDLYEEMDEDARCEMDAERIQWQNINSSINMQIQQQTQGGSKSIVVHRRTLVDKLRDMAAEELMEQRREEGGGGSMHVAGVIGSSSSMIRHDSPSPQHSYAPTSVMTSRRASTASTGTSMVRSSQHTPLLTPSKLGPAAATATSSQHMPPPPLPPHPSHSTPAMR